VTAHPLSCSTVNVWPAAVIVPLRRSPGLPAISIRTVPLPVPLAPEGIVIQGAVEVAVQLQLSAVRMSKFLDPPPAGTVALSGSRVAAQPCPWLTVNVRPAMVSVPVRAGPSVAARREHRRRKGEYPPRRRQ